MLLAFGAESHQKVKPSFLKPPCDVCSVTYLGYSQVSALPQGTLRPWRVGPSKGPAQSLKMLQNSKLNPTYGLLAVHPSSQDALLVEPLDSPSLSGCVYSVYLSV